MDMLKVCVLYQNKMSGVFGPFASFDKCQECLVELAGRPDVNSAWVEKCRKDDVIYQEQVKEFLRKIKPDQETAAEPRKHDRRA